MSERFQGANELTTVVVQPDPIWDMVEIDEVDNVAQSYRRISMSHGYFYKAVVTRLSRGMDVNMPELLSTVPLMFREYYQKGWENFQHELELNEMLLAKRKGDEVGSILLKSTPDLSDEIAEIILDNAGDIKFFKPSPGIGVFAVSGGYYTFLATHGIVPKDSIGCFYERSGMVPSYVVYDSSHAEAEEVLDHEVSHQVIDVLQWSSFPITKDRFRDVNRSFKQFKDELACYLVSGIDIAERQHTALSRIGGKRADTWAKAAHDFVSNCISTSRANGIDPLIYIYSVMVAKNYRDLMERFTRVTDWDLSEGVGNDLVDGTQRS